jgi:prefoldin subunit 5
MCERHSVRSVVRALFAPVQEAEALPAIAPEPVQASGSTPRRRRRLWELEEKHHCPVVGSCLTLEELKKLARQGGFQGGRFDAYRLHVEAVSLAGSRNAVSERIQALLERKYAAWVSRFKQARSDEAVRALWCEHLERGEVAGAMWAALTHPLASAETRHQVYADVHMLSHQVGAGQAAELRRLHWLERAHAEAAQRHAEETRRHAEAMAQLRERCQALETECQQLREEVRRSEAMRERLARLESGQVMVEMGRRLLLLEAGNAELRAAAARSQSLEARLQALQAENARLTAERDGLIAERDALERLWLEEVDAADADPRCTGDCVQCSERLRGRCVLCVGGRPTLLAQYRKLAERLGVRLIHHDGGREDALGRLPELLSASDAVICPTDSVSHAAYGQLKRHCKATNKPCVLARTSSIAGFAAALARLAENRADLRNQFL